MPSDPIARLLSHTLSVPDNKTVAPDYAVGRIASRTMEIGVWHMRLPEGAIVFSEKARVIIGLDADTATLRVDQLLSRFTKTGRIRAAELIGDAIEKKRGFQVEAEIVDFNNQIRCVEYFGDVELDGDGDVVGLVGTVRDLTAARHTARMASSRMAIIKALMKNVPLAIGILDRQMRYLAVSDRWIADFKLKTAEDVLGKSHYDLVDIPETMRQEHKQVLAGVTLVRRRSFFKDEAGNPIMQNAILAPWYERHEEIGGMMIILAGAEEDRTTEADGAVPQSPTSGEFDHLIAEIGGH